jgi:hypothetical protein
VVTRDFLTVNPVDVWFLRIDGVGIDMTNFWAPMGSCPALED